MRLKMLSAIAAGAALVVTPVAASAATNPAASLSVAKSVRASAPSGSANHLRGGGSGAFLGVVILVGIIAIIVIGATKKDNIARSA